MNYKFGLRLKLLIIFLIFSAILSAAILKYYERSFKESIMAKYYENAVSIAKLSASTLDGDELEVFANTLKSTDDYNKIQESLNNIKKQTGVYYLYVIYPYNKERGIYLFDAQLTKGQEEAIGSGASVLGDEVIFGGDYPSALKLMDTGKPSDKLDITQTLQGNMYQWLASAYAPVFNSKGKVVAFAGVDINITDINGFIDEASFRMAEVVVGIVLLCMLVLIIIIQRSVIRPVKVLKNYAEEITEGKFGRQMKIKGHDEISEISSVFNRMSGSIEGNMNEIKIINDAYHKFVPSQIFELLNKSSVTQVQLGNQINVELAVLYFNVPGFGEIIRKMTGTEMFCFINNVLNSALPFIIEKDGVVETFQDAGFSAFYAGKCEASLASAVSICQKINIMNRNKHFGIDEPLKSAIAITLGPVMLGIVGHDKRLSTISISEQTKMAEHLQHIADKYYSRIIVTAAAAGKIPKFEKTYHSRFLGFFYYSAADHYEKLYDVFDGDEEEDMRLKLLTKKTFEEGVKYFCARQFSDARLAFINVLKTFRKDNAAREYLYLCNNYCQLENPDTAAIYIEKL